jgi:hypothetical protein
MLHRPNLELKTRKTYQLTLELELRGKEKRKIY